MCLLKRIYLIFKKNFKIYTKFPNLDLKCRTKLFFSNKIAHSGCASIKETSDIYSFSLHPNAHAICDFTKKENIQKLGYLL